MAFLLQFDRSIFVWINTDWTNSIFNLMMPWITHLGDPTIVWLWILCIALLRVRHFARSTKKALSNRQQQRLFVRFGLFFCLFLAVIYGVNAGLCECLKLLFNRPRPFEQQNVILRVSSNIAANLCDNGSFPSGHASNAFMVAAFLSEFIQNKRIVFYGLAVLLALSRIYLGVHFPSDVFVGAFLGWSITRSMFSFRWLRNRITREEIFLFRQVS